MQLNEAHQKRTEPAVSLADSDSQPDDQPADDCASIHKSVLRQQNSSTPKPNKNHQNNNNKDDSTARQSVADGKTSAGDPHDQSNCENQPLKGILKYSCSWKKRTLSESSFDNSSSFTDHEDEDNNFSLSLSCTDLDVYAERSAASKRVTFNKQVSQVKFARNQLPNEPTAAGKKKGKNGKKKNKKAKNSDNNEKSERKAASNEKSPKKQASDQEEQQAGGEDVPIDELSFLLCSSGSDGSLEKESPLENSAIGERERDRAGEQETEQAAEEEDDLLDLQSKIEHQPFDDEWSEMKSSRKKNRKSRNSQTGGGDGEEKRENAEHDANESSESNDSNDSNDDSATAPSSCEQASQPMSLGMKQNLAIEVN